MKNFTKISLMILILLSLSDISVFAGVNASAKIRFDLNSSATGNQNQTTMSCPGTGTYVRMDIYAIDVNDFDTYEFWILYPAGDLNYESASESNPITHEKNIFKAYNTSNEGVAWMVDSDTDGELGIAFTLAELTGANDPPDDNYTGLLASVEFLTEKDCPGTLTFGTTKYYDSEGTWDLITDKGDASLPVQLSSMKASASRKSGITLTWQTESELNCAGFHVWKSEQEISGYQKITSTLIPGHGNTSVANLYTHIDREVEDNVIYWYKIEEISMDGKSIFMGPVSATGIKPVPREFALSQNYPNPFNPETTFGYQLPEETDVLICIYNTLGKRVKTLVDKHQEAGYYTETWQGLNEDGRKVSSGIYLLSIETKEYRNVKKISLMR